MKFKNNLYSRGSEFVTVTVPYRTVSVPYRDRTVSVPYRVCTVSVPYRDRTVPHQNWCGTDRAAYRTIKIYNVYLYTGPILLRYREPYRTKTGAVRFAVRARYGTVRTRYGSKFGPPTVKGIENRALIEEHQVAFSKIKFFSIIYDPKLIIRPDF